MVGLNASVADEVAEPALEGRVWAALELQARELEGLDMEELAMEGLAMEELDTATADTAMGTGRALPPGPL